LIILLKIDIQIYKILKVSVKRKKDKNKEINRLWKGKGKRKKIIEKKD
jgi:hypothetical protein